MRHLGLAVLCVLISVMAGCARQTQGAIETAPAAAHQDSGRDNSTGGGGDGGSM